MVARTDDADIYVAGPSARDHVAMDYDAHRRAVVLHGGGLSDDIKRETWTFDGKSWARAATSGPPRRYARMAYDVGSKAVLLYGGYDRNPSNEIWRFDGTAWSAVR